MKESKRSISSFRVCLMKNSNEQFLTLFVQAKASICMTRNVFKPQVMSSTDPSSFVKVLSHKSRRYWETGCDFPGSPSGASRSTFSAISHLMAHTFISLAVQWRTVRPLSSRWLGSAPDCSSKWISELGALLRTANIRGVLTEYTAGYRSTSAPAWNRDN